jgi:hypothetical protein
MKARQAVEVDTKIYIEDPPPAISSVWSERIKQQQNEHEQGLDI